MNIPNADAIIQHIELARRKNKIKKQELGSLLAESDKEQSWRNAYHNWQHTIAAAKWLEKAQKINEEIQGGAIAPEVIIQGELEKLKIPKKIQKGMMEFIQYYAQK